ncbi:MAG TPA: hypothetical protein VGD88_11455 [Opitutaceae bacterium]
MLQWWVQRWPSSHRPTAAQAWGGYAVATVALAAGIVMAARRYGEPFDWMYQVISTLASAKRNPAGSVWFASGLGIAMLALVPTVAWLRLDRRGLPDPALRFPTRALGLGLACGMILALEHLTVAHLSDHVRKAHEITALLTFLGLYVGIIGHYVVAIRRDPTSLWSALVLVVPIIAIGVSQAVLYFGQRDLGWVDRSWRGLGVPLWLSFAFWQWLAVALLWAGLGQLVAAGGQRQR